MPKQKEIVVVGAGPGGLAVAIQLAVAGARVVVLERMGTVGGRTSSIEEDGFRFDLGPTFFLYPQILDQILRTAGTSLREEVEMVRLDPQYRIQFSDGAKIDATPRAELMEAQIAAICAEDAAGFIDGEAGEDLDPAGAAVGGEFHGIAADVGA